MANSKDPDQLASEKANWSGSTLFAKAGYIRVQQDKELLKKCFLTGFYVLIFVDFFAFNYFVLFIYNLYCKY